MPCYGAALSGLRSVRVRVNCKVDPGGGKGLSLIGNVGPVVREIKPILPHAFESQDLPSPAGRITIQLQPVDLPKGRSVLYLPIALALFLRMPDMVIDEEEAQTESPPWGQETSAADERDLRERAKRLIAWAERIREIEHEIARRSLFCIGEVNIEGEILRVDGALNLLDQVRAGDVVIVPEENLREAQFWTATKELEGGEVYAVSTLREAVEVALSPGRATAVRRRALPQFRNAVEDVPDMCQIVGQEAAKKALEIAAAGGHHCLLCGPQGEGKTMLARALAGILPRLDPGTNMGEILEINRIWSARGMLPDGELVLSRPFREVPPGVTMPALLGGGRGDPRPGEVSLAHRGVLYMDEFPQHPRVILESLREPLQSRKITVSRMGGAAVFPAGFILVAAMNPCRCGRCGEYECPACHATLPQELARCKCGTARPPKHRCICGPAGRRKFEELLSGPLQDRIHLKVRVYSSDAPLSLAGEGEKSTTVRRRVQRARRIQAARFRKTRRTLNSEIETPDEISNLFNLSTNARRFVQKFRVAFPYPVNVRTAFQTLSVARTIADLEESDKLCARHIAEAALHYTRPLLASIEERLKLPPSIGELLAKAGVSEN